LWAEIADRVPTAKTVYAAVAYFAQNGAKLLPLRKGHKLVVDMSIGAVRQGVTDPREVRKLMKRGVQVYSRGTLHSKFIIFDNALLVGSANISFNSRDNLDEAAILTTDPAAVRRAKTFFLDHMCVEPVGEEYLKTCIKAYRPPSSKAAAGQARSGRKGHSRAVEAKVWFITVWERNIPKEEKPLVKNAIRRAGSLLKSADRTEVDCIHYRANGRVYLQHVRIGDWVVECFRDKNGCRQIWPPAQVLGVESYATKIGGARSLLMLEMQTKGEPMPFSQFRRRVKSLVPELDKDSPRARPITDIGKADLILTMWTRSGRISKRRSSR